jgi:hypothetical protein
MKRTRLVKDGSKRLLRDLKYDYVRQYSEFTPESVMHAIDAVTDKYGVLSAQAVHHHLVAKRFGGLGMGVPKRRGSR